MRVNNISILWGIVFILTLGRVFREIKQIIERELGRIIKQRERSRKIKLSLV
jgi:hypothetical protein